MKKIKNIINALMISGTLLFSNQVHAENDNERTQAAKRISTGLINGIVASQNIKSGDESIDAALNYLNRIYKLANKTKPRIAIWPYQQDKIPIPKDVADELNAAVLANLIQQSNGRFVFVARESLRSIISDMQETGALGKDGKNPISALMENAQNISILIEGKLTLKNRKISVSYKAVRVDGTIVASTTPEIIRLQQDELNTDRATLSLNQALVVAAKDLANRAPDMKELRLDGIRFETSGLQPSFGRYALDKLSVGLQTEFSNSLSGQALKVKEARIDLKETFATNGLNQELKTSNKQLLMSTSLTGGVYLLSGTYWDMGNSLELRVSLTGVDGKTSSWSGSIRTDTVMGLKIHPENKFGGQRENDNLGPTRFSLTTNKGDDPIFHIGENMDLAIRLSRDAWVYCFYQQADGSTIQIFPNPHFLGIYSEPKLEGKRVHIIPGQTTFPFDLKFQPPVGEELLKCFSTSKDVTSQLPAALRGISLAPIPNTLDRKLSQIFRAIPNVSVSEASVVVTVVE